MLRAATIKSYKLARLPRAVAAAGLFGSAFSFGRSFVTTNNFRSTENDGKDQWTNPAGRMPLRNQRLYSAKENINRLAREKEIGRILREKDMNREAKSESPVKVSKSFFITPGFTEQLNPLALDLQPVAATSPGGGEGDGGSDANHKEGSAVTNASKQTKNQDTSPALGEDVSTAKGCLPQTVLEQSFSQSIRSDLFNTLLVGLARRSHMLLYSEDPWSEGYSVPLLVDFADKIGAHITALDIPDLAVLTSRIDPVLEDLTIVSHTYSPPPDLATGNYSDGSGMSFFAGVRKRYNDEGDIMSEQMDSKSSGSALSKDDEDANPDDDTVRMSDIVADAVRARMKLGKGFGNAVDRFEDSDNDVGDPVLSREMMTNPLSKDATERLDRVLGDFVAASSMIDGIAQPQIVVIKHLGDLLNTRIGYTLFSRLTGAISRHNSNSNNQPVSIVGLMHPSIFHQDTPPPGIPPFDINPATPVALMPGDGRTKMLRRGLGDIVEGLLGEGGGRGVDGNIGVKVVHMNDVQPNIQFQRRAGMPSFFNSDVAEKQDELPLFTRIGIPPPSKYTFSVAYNMDSPYTKHNSKASDQLVGSLRQLLTAEQCLDRNARVIRNICLLYQVPGLEITKEEALGLRIRGQLLAPATTATKGKGKKKTSVFYREPLYADINQDPVVAKSPRSDIWTLDYRPLAAMLRTLPDDVARRFFFGETFLHRWVSLAQALAIREQIGLDTVKKDYTTLSKATKGALLASRHLKDAWIQLLESSMALRQGYRAADPGSSLSVHDDSWNSVENDDSVYDGFPLHRQVDFAELEVGRVVEDDMELPPDISKLQKHTQVVKTDPKGEESIDTAENNSTKEAVVDTKINSPVPISNKPAFRKWSDVSMELSYSDGYDDYDNETGKGSYSGSVASPQKRILAAKKALTEYEQRLMSSVVDPLSIPTGFSQVCVKPETVTTLQEIITLPMLRPEYFSKGVLRRYGVSGILLFGPPGTGKTMLAKAVAKESGSVVLNIRASDIYDKYVGEGEKLAEAVFTLARKLAPCVIFIDEVDALFSARSSGEANKFRRDIMNQIMSEWDGINTSRKRATDGSANSSTVSPPPQVMVMAATNRPFDLDDAILRRLPRRILIDLPDVEDRAKILAIHLQGEDLDSDVDLKAVAKRTESFSGSDLKNLCVAAALAALRERVRKEVGTRSKVVADADSAVNASADKVPSNKGDEGQLSVSLIEQLKTIRHSTEAAGAGAGRKMPPIKLADRHFGIALKKVAPSSSDQMESLIELRKWDKIYGDGAQERKRKPQPIGFANAKTESNSSNNKTDSK